MVPVVRELAAQGSAEVDVWAESQPDVKALGAALGRIASSIRTSTDAHHLVVVAGSLYLVADFYRMIDPSSQGVEKVERS